MPPIDLGLQADLAIRLLIAAVLGGAIGFEREVHDHPAGTRTHLLVSLGSAVFTELSIYGFEAISAPGVSPVVDPSRIAAQVVSGVGFLGAGAILKYGTSVRGLTTAASLWTTAAVGMAAGAGAWLTALVATLIVFLSLWPLRALDTRVRRRGRRTTSLRLAVSRLDAIVEIAHVLAARGVELAGITSERIGQGRHEVRLDLRLDKPTGEPDVIAQIVAIPDVEILDSAAPE